MAVENDPCVFCEIIAGRKDADIVWDWNDALAFVPLGPMVEGHTLVVPKIHVPDFADDTEVCAATARRASQLAYVMGGPMNMITSKGTEATQSVFHLHLHLVPRAANDGLKLPWCVPMRSNRDSGQ